MVSPLVGKVQHPAKFSDELIPQLYAVLKGTKNVLDPMAGVGKITHIRELGYDGLIYCNELEPEWAEQIEGAYKITTCDARNLPYPDNFFDAICTSPVYGNRMCLAGDTLVLCWDGYKPISEVKVGDYVLTHRGRWREVKWAGQTGVRSVIELDGQAGGKLVCTPDHRIYANKNSRTWRPIVLGEPDWIEARDMQGRYWAMWSSCLTEPSPLELPQLPNHTLEIKDIEWFWWAIGFWLANGWGHYTLEDSGLWTRAYVGWCTNLEFADVVQDNLTKAFGERTKAQSYIKNNVRRWRVYSQELLKWLYKHFGRYAHGKYLPGWVLSLPCVYKKAIIDGWMFGDGHVSNIRGYEEFIGVSVSAPLARGMQTLAQTLGYSTSFRLGKSARKEKVVDRVINVRDAWRLAVVKRKTKYAHSQANLDWYYVRSVTPLATEIPVYDLVVDEDHSFVANGVIVHNSDSHNAKDGSKRITYTHMLGRKLTKGNTGNLQWGKKYRQAHVEIWQECIRVLKPNGIFILNISDHIRRGQVVPVSEWHKQTLVDMGLEYHNTTTIETKRMRFGANSHLRVGHENIFVFRKPEFN